MYVETYETVKSVKKIRVLILSLFSLMLITTVCILFLIKLRWMKSILNYFSYHPIWRKRPGNKVDQYIGNANAGSIRQMPNELCGVCLPETKLKKRKEKTKKTRTHARGMYVACALLLKSISASGNDLMESSFICSSRHY